MTVIAGLDIGNTTTEVVIVDTSAAGSPAGTAGTGAAPVGAQPSVLGWDRAATRGRKGSDASVHGAAALLRRTAARLGVVPDLVAVAPLRPVVTRATSLPQGAPRTGRLDPVRVGGATPGGLGTAIGVPADLDGEPVLGTPVVLLVRRGTGYATTVEVTRRWLAAGADVRGLLLADDEGVLVAARLPAPLPVADEVAVDAVRGARLVAMEIRPPGHRLQDLADPIRLSGLLGLSAGERADAVAVADSLGDGSRGVVALLASRSATGGHRDPAGSLLMRDGTEPTRLATGVWQALVQAPVGAVRSWRPSPDDPADVVDDLWVVELREIAASVAARVDATTARALVVAGLVAGDSPRDPAGRLADELGLPVGVVGTEAAAARIGAGTTPGVRPGVTVVDLGGGTVDVIGPDGTEVVAAGAGEMLTVAVATFLGLPRGAADWVKRVPCSRLEAPHVLLAEDGGRTFLDQPAESAAVGSLVVPGPAGLLPFGGGLAAAEWRALRLRTKQRVLVDNVARALRTLGGRPDDVLLVGGAAADEELVGLLRPELPGAAVGRGDVAGRLGHRYAVAYGLALLGIS